MKKSHIIFATIFGVVILLNQFIPSNATDGKNEILHMLSPEEAIEYLEIQVLDKTLQWDGKVDVAYTNRSDTYIFTISKTGLKYNDSGGKTKYLKRDTPVSISPNQTVTLVMSIPFLIEPRVAYAFKDDIKVSN